MNISEKRFVKKLRINETIFAQMSATFVLTGGALLTATTDNTVIGLSIIYAGIYCCTVAEKFHSMKNQYLDIIEEENKKTKIKIKRG